MYQQKAREAGRGISGDERGENDMALTLLEQETVINYNRDEDFMTVYTADPALMRRLKKLPAYELMEESRQDGKVIAMTFKADKSLVTLRGAKKKAKEYTEEEMEELRERGRRIRANQLRKRSK